jgi:hypothetical protein
MIPVIEVSEWPAIYGSSQPASAKRVKALSLRSWKRLLTTGV